MKSSTQKSVSFANSSTFLSASSSSQVKSSSVGDLNHHRNDNHSDENYDVSYYFCESVKNNSSLRNNQNERKYCSFCRTTHGTFSNKEGIERFFRKDKFEKRKTNFLRGEIKFEDLPSSEECFETQSSSSEFGERSSSSSSSLSIEGEKMYKCSTEMAKDKLLRMRLKSRDHARNTRLNVSRSSSYVNCNYRDGEKVSINIVMPAIGYDSDNT